MKPVFLASALLANVLTGAAIASVMVRKRRFAIPRVHLWIPALWHLLVAAGVLRQRGVV